jgi:thymidylate synthase (FAD)
MRLKPAQQREIAELKTVIHQTRRATVTAIEEILYDPMPVLDQGFIRVIDYMGDDGAIVQAARVSYGRGTKRVRDDAALIKYLMRNQHTSPFEMCEIKLHVKLPIFVARQWIRHRTASVNEYSARYSILDNEFYIPAPAQLGVQSTANRQGRENSLTPQETERVLKLLREDAERSYQHYEELLNETQDGTIRDPSRQGLARELARINLSLAFYTEWYWKIDLHNLMHFLQLRSDEHAQYEIREYANEILAILKRWVPLTYEAFVENRMTGVHLSAKELNAVRRLLAGEELDPGRSGLTQREWRQLVALLGIASK